jgi:hypothetical protein
MASAAGALRFGDGPVFLTVTFFTLVNDPLFVPAERDCTFARFKQTCLQEQVVD